MGISSLTEEYVEVIQRLAASPHLSLVVGAGASIPSQLPGWEKLINRLLTRESFGTSSSVADRIVATQGYLLAAEAAFARGATADERKAQVALALYEENARESFLPSELHQAIALLASQRGPDGLQIFTTNYDELIEQALRSQGLKCRPRYTAANRGSRSAFPIHHIHGFLGLSKDSKDVVLGHTDYARISVGSSDWPGEAISTAASNGPVLFVGASLTDPNLLRILDRLKDREYEKSVLVLARQGLDVPWGLREEFRRLLEIQWSHYNVEVVLLEDFCDISLFVRELASAHEEAYVPPRERLQAVWSPLWKHFDKAQQDFAETLERGIETHLRRYLGPVGNLALWLNDARGRLVKFAVNDRLHRSPKTLHHIEDRYDTGWVVSEAVAYENTIVRDLRTPSLSGDEDSQDGPELRSTDQRWNVIAVTPLRPALGGRGHIVAGALSCAAVSLDEKNFGAINRVLGQKLAAEWETVLETLYQATEE